MPRVKRGITAHRRHKKVLVLTKGHRATKHSLYRRAHESMLKSLSYAYVHRRERKGDMRRLWILRVNAASRAQGLTYSQFIDGLKKMGLPGGEAEAIKMHATNEFRKTIVEKGVNRASSEYSMRKGGYHINPIGCTVASCGNISIIFSYFFAFRIIGLLGNMLW